jgi:hypothetical protein
MQQLFRFYLIFHVLDWRDFEIRFKPLELTLEPMSISAVGFLLWQFHDTLPESTPILDTLRRKHKDYDEL